MIETISLVIFGMTMLMGGIGIGLLIAGFLLERERGKTNH